MKNVYFLLSLLLIGLQAKAQNTLPPNQPEQSSCDPLIICDYTFTSPYSYQGLGTRNDLTNTPCSGGEANSVWLKISVNTPGIIVFTVTPLVATDDYDMAVLDVTNVPCDQLTTANVIRCNYNNNQPGSNVNGAIGLNTTSTLLYVTGGSFGNSFLQQINANAGDEYLIMLNNFGYYSGTGVLGGGFTIDFTGSTATFNQPPAPKLDGIEPYCDLSQKVTVKLNQLIKCSSIAPDGSDFTLSPSGSIISAVGNNCAMALGGYSDEITLTFASPLPTGTYTLNAAVGTDGNTLLNLCDGPLPIPSSIPFQVGNLPIKIASLDTPACQYLTITLNSPVRCSSISPNLSEFSISGPSNVGIMSVTGSGCLTNTSFTNKLYIALSNPITVDGEYTLYIMNGTDNNTLIDSCNRSVPVGEHVKFTINSYNGKLVANPDGLKACYFDQQINLTMTANAKAPSNGFVYEWISPNPVTNNIAQNTTGTVPNILNYFIAQTTDSFGCILRDSVKITVQPFHTAITPESSLVCLGKDMILEATDGEQFKWFVSQGSAAIETPTLFKTMVTPDLGNIVIGVEAKDSRGCIDSAFAYLTVKTGPELTVTPKDTTIHYGDQIKISAHGAQNYLWYPNTNLLFKDLPQVDVNPKEDTWYQVTGWNEDGCTSIDSVLVRVAIISNPFLPNAFSPNGDGLNDEFKIGNFKHERLLVFKIYDRYGKEVFSTSQKDKGWDGTYPNGNEAEPGVYFYYLEYTHQDSRLEQIKGDLTLLR